jgi:ubiquinone/menaquinone biosynthesis C-methylase UbiE
MTDLAAPSAWLEALERRHLADLRVAEVTRALRALSSSYVERRRSAVPATLEGAGKRAAFALFYAPLHFLTVAAVVDGLGAAVPPPRQIVDIGCGTGVAGAAWSLAAGGQPPVSGIDRHPWAVSEARWTFSALGLRGRATQGDLTRLPRLVRGDAVVAAYALNELANDAREKLEGRLLDAAGEGVRVLVVEPIARSAAPWWEGSARRWLAAGGRDDEWRLPLELPPLVKQFDRAAGLDHRIVTCRSLYLPGRRP